MLKVLKHINCKKHFFNFKSDLCDAATFVPLSQVPPDLTATVPPDISATFNKVDICPTYN
jgi:cell wall assembly regulator SMI1